MTRWGAPTEFEVIQVNAVSIASSRVVKNIPEEYRVRPLHNQDFVWPSYEEIRTVQKQHFGSSAYVNAEGLVICKTGKIKIPLEAQDLRIRLCIIAHAGGNSGHLGYQAATSKLKEYFHWLNMDKDMRDFCNNCLHCLPTR